MTGLVLAAVAFAAMEPVAYLLHRYVMHGPGLRWHASHHRPPTGRFERNDLYPVVLATTTVAVMATGATVDALWFLLPIGAGVTAYGACYAAVHDGVIHRRLPVLRRAGTDRGALAHLADAHALHHRFGGEPYGMLLPVVPRPVRDRAATRDRTPSIG